MAQTKYCFILKNTMNGNPSNTTLMQYLIHLMIIFCSALASNGCESCASHRTPLYCHILPLPSILPFTLYIVYCILANSQPSSSLSLFLSHSLILLLLLPIELLCGLLINWSHNQMVWFISTNALAQSKELTTQWYIEQFVWIAILLFCSLFRSYHCLFASLNNVYIKCQKRIMRSMNKTIGVIDNKFSYTDRQINQKLAFWRSFASHSILRSETLNLHQFLVLLLLIGYHLKLIISIISKIIINSNNL